VIFFSAGIIQALMYNYSPYYAGALVDSTVYNLYDDHDIRKTAFFRESGSNHYFKGSYATNIYELFSGITTSELLLNKAECLARAGNKDGALASLNLLLEKRLIAGSFVPLQAGDANEALQLVLKERRKELLY